MMETPTGVSTRAHRACHQHPGYAQESLSPERPRCCWAPAFVTTSSLRRRTWLCRPKRLPVGRPLAGQGSVAYTPSHAVPLTWHLNYGRGINSIDARGVVQHPEEPRLATLDFYQAEPLQLRTLASPRTCFLIGPLQRTGLHPRRRQFRIQGPSRAYG